METDHVAGLPESQGGSGDPSPVTAKGVYMGMKGAAKFAFGTESLNGKKVMVQGVGSVGTHLVEYLIKEGAVVSIADIHQDAIKAVSSRFKVNVVAPDDVFDTDMDIYAPCALGATVNDESLAKLKCSVIVGAANNQLSQEDVHGRKLLEKGIVYAPDFLVNAGGIINCYAEVAGYDSHWAMEEVEKIFNTTQEILRKSRDENIPSYLAANRMAEARIEAVRGISAGF
jgi:leucine dehydrogenase